MKKKNLRSIDTFDLSHELRSRGFDVIESTEYESLMNDSKKLLNVIKKYLGLREWADQKAVIEAINELYKMI